MIFRGLARSLWPVQRAGFVSRNLWKVGLGIAAAVLLTSRGTTEAPHLPQLSGRVAAAQSVPCGALGQGIVTWSAPSYILPSNDPNGAAPCTAGVIVGPGTTLLIDAGAGTVHIASSGAGLNIAGGTLKTVNADETLNPDGTRAHGIIFEAATDVASWDGINITASGLSKGNASLSYVSIQGALRSIQISSGATSSPDDSHYGLTIRNSSIGFSYFDGIDAIDTPISVTGLGNGHTGTINNIGSIGISSVFTISAPPLPADALLVDGMTFGSSAPFGVSNCPANQPCYIGNEAISGQFVAHATQPVSITGSSFYRAGNYGVKLVSASQPTLTNNLFACNGLGAPTTGPSCSGSGPVYSAVSLSDATADLAQAPGSTGQITGNHGYGNGLDAIAFNGAVTSRAMTWQNATNVNSDVANTHWLGYLLTGDLNMANATLTVPNGGIVKTLGGTINLTNSTLDAGSAGAKTFTSLRDPVGITSCPTVFAPSCGPAVLPGGEWGGINLAGRSKGTVNNANIFYAATGIRVAGGATSTGTGNNYGLVVSNSTIGPTFSDGIAATATPISVTNTHFQCAGSGCQPPAAGDHGISADFTGSAALGDGLLLAGNTFHGSVNEAIKGVGLAGQKVDIENNTVDHAGTAGIQLVGADRPTLKQNTITSSGTGTPTYPAIYLNGVTRADFNSAITGNAGSGNGLDAIAFHGGSTSLTWRTVANSTSTAPFGYLLDGPLAVNGNLSLPQNAHVPSLGSITVTGGALTANGAVVTSLKDSTVNIPTCGSVFDQRVSGACPAARPGDWTGLTLDSGFASSLSGSEIRYAATGIAMGKQGSVSIPLALNGTNVRNLSVDGIATQSSLAVSGGAFSNLGGRAIAVDLTGVAAGASVSITGASIGGTGSEGILARGLAGHTVLIDGTSVDHSRAVGINLAASDHLTLTNNTVTNTPVGYPAIYLNGFTGKFIDKLDGTKYVDGNKGAGNGLDALAFHGTVNDDLTWITARKSGAVRPLGYLLDGDLNLAGTLQVGAGDIVKSSGALNIGHLHADDTSNAAQKIFTSLGDDAAGVAVCHPASVLLPGCTGAAAGDWGGINLASDGALVNGAVRYAATGINVSGGTATTYGSSSYGLLVSRSRIEASKFDAIDSLGTPASVTNSSINGAIHGISVDFTGGPSTAALRLSGNRFSNTGAEALVGQALGGHPLWITDNQVQNAMTFGIRLVGADQLVLRNNNISGSGGGPSAGAARYPAIWLSGVTADFTRDVRGNVGGANGLDAIVADGTAVGNVNWITPSNGSSSHALGYLLDGGFVVDGGTLTVPAGGKVQVLGGAIKINGGAVKATGATFTSLKDGTAVTPIPCPSVFVLVCVPSRGDWGGLMITEDSAAHHGSGTITGGRIAYAATGISIDSGPIASGEAANFRLSVSGTEIAQASNDGINSTDTPISVDSSTISGVGAHGVIASFFSPANCGASPVPCSRLSVTNSTITSTGKDGIVANGLAEQPVNVNHNTITSAATYGIRLVGANELNMSSNTVSLSGSPGSGVQYPAIYLNSVTADFGGKIGTNLGSGNGLNALVFHGTANNGLTWITPSPSGTLGYMLDGPLTVNGALNTTGVVKVLTGGIKVNGVLTSVDTAFTSMRDATTLPVCNTVFVPSGCPSTAAAGDWGGINVDPVGTSTFTRSSIAYATTGLTISGGEIDITGATLTHNSRYALSTAGTGIALVTCTGIHDNGGGILANGAATSIDNSDLYGNVTTTGKDFDGTGPSSASRVWWNGIGIAGAPDPTTQYNAGTVTVDKSLPQQQPSVKAPLLSSIQFSSDNTNSATGNFGTGTLKVTLTFDRTMNVNAPLSVNFGSAIDSVVHPVVGGHFTNNVTWEGSAPIDSLTDQAGINTLSIASGASCMRDGNNVMTTETATFKLDFSTATVDDSTGATHIGTSSATINGVVNANGWSQPLSNPATQTYAFVEEAAVGTNLPDPATVIAGVTNPSSLFGYAPIGHGSTPLAVSQAVTGLAPSTAYHYAVVAVDLNGITLGADTQFTTTGPATGFTITDPPASNVAGSGIAETVAATDGTRVVADYVGNVTLSSTDAQAAFKVAAGDTPAPLPTTLTFAASDFGSRTLTVIFKTSGPQSLTALDGGGLTGSGGGVTVVAAGLDHLALSPHSSTVASNAGQAYTVDARDAYDNSLGDETSSTTFSIAPDGSCATATCSATIADIGASHHTVTGTFNGKTGTATLIVTARLPGVPTGVTATPSNGSANVTWAAPADTGGSPITKYTVTSSPDGKTAVTPDGTTLTATVTGLTNGTAYTFTVVATNAAGNGPPSTASTAVTPRTAPGAPTAVSATPGNGSAVVTWTAPTDNGGSPITGYTVTSSPTGGTPVVSGTTATVPALANGTSYIFTVVATNAAGDSAPSAPSSAVTPRTTPGAPTVVSAAAGDGSVSVTWTAPTDKGGSPVTKYTVTSSPDNKTAVTPDGSTLTATVSGLTNGTVYTFTVVATNAAGDGSPSAASTSATPQTPAGVPSKLVFTTQPSGSTGGIAFGTQPVVAVEDTFGTVITADNTSTVTLSITAGTGNSAGALTCTSMSASMTAGQATFAGCAIDKIGNGYTLHAVSSLGSVTAANSDPVTITLGPAAKLGVTTQPSSSTGGIAFGTQPVVAVEDAGGNLQIGDSSSTVALSINAGTGDPAGALTCTTIPLTVSGGSAIFAGCAIDRVSPSLNSYTLHAVSSLGGVTAANTAPVTITLGPAAKLAFTTQPAGAGASTAFTTQPVVSVEDAGGNVVATDSSTVATLSITPLTGDPAATLTCNPPGNQQTAVNGNATFSGCAIDKPSTGYRVHASGAGFQTDSQAFTVS